MSKLTGAALDRAVANALGLKSVNNCEKWSSTMGKTYEAIIAGAKADGSWNKKYPEEDDDIQDYKKPWVGLTDEEIDKTYWAMPRVNKPQPTQFEFARAIEQLLKEKNNA